jgi:chlorobactene glucosyltransferase
MHLFLLYQYFVLSILVIFLINFILNNIFFKNIAGYSLPESFIKRPPLVSIMVPARNEAENIKMCVKSLLKQDYANIEILILDDNSTDDTSLIVKRIAEKDSRVKLITGKPLKDGWIGKSYACHQLAKHARGRYFLFTDADTLYFKNAVSSTIGCLIKNKLDALSAIPKQIMVGIHERLVVTWVHFGILSLLPLILIKKSKYPLFCTANGQCMLFKREVYRKIGGHKSIKTKILEDIHISKQVKRHGYRFMLFDGSKNIYCRMYRNFRGLIKGFSKFMFAAFDFKVFNIAVAILFISVIFLFPFIFLPLGILLFNWPYPIVNLIIIQIFVVLTMRIILAIRLNNRILDTFLHPVSMLYIILLCINSVLQTKFGEGAYWKGRGYDIRFR